MSSANLTFGVPGINPDSVGETNKASSGAVDRIMDAVGSLLPDCGTALRLAKTGSERPLKLGERLQLRYNSRLCLYCSCKKEKFAEAMDGLRAAERERRG